ncbi:MAG: UDP-glucose 4-epimerase [Myxococcota bacterium]|jgi:UDP-glucose 4-epimerase
MGQVVVVTGGAGYIGSHLVVELLAAGCEVHIIDSLVRGRREAVERAAKIGGADVPLHVTDLNDTGAITRILRDIQPTTVFHAAAFKSVSESVAHPERYDLNNIQATHSLCLAMEAAGVRQVVYASTGSVYGDRPCEAFHETDPTAPINPYGSTKLGGEGVLDAFSARTGAGVSHMRFFNVVGAHPSAQLGEFGDETTNLLPILLDQLSGRRDAVTIFGTDWDTHDGTCIRDYVHVCDIASALVAAMNGRPGATDTRIFNVGTGIGTSVSDLIAAVGKASGKSLTVHNGPRREGDPGVCVAAVQRIQNELNWKATFSLDPMVTSALAWTRQLTSAS